MQRRLKKVISSIIIVFGVIGMSLSFAEPDTSESNKDITMVISLCKAESDLHTLPKFIISLTNNSRKNIEILKSWERGSLLDHFIELKVFKSGKLLEPKYLISDPGSISKEDYILLPPQKSVEFTIDDYGQDYGLLESGEYLVVATMKNMNSNHVVTYFKSNTLSFTITRKVG